MRQNIVLVILILLVLIQYKIFIEANHNVNDQCPQRRTAKDHTLRPVPEIYKARTTTSIYRLTISRLKTELILKAYAIHLNCQLFFDRLMEYFAFECSIYNTDIPSSFQRVQLDKSQKVVNRMIQKLPVEKRKEGLDIRGQWADTCLDYVSKVTALSRTHADEWNSLIDTRLLNHRIYGELEGYDDIGQLMINAVIRKDTLWFENKILRLSRKQKKEIHCLTPPESPMNANTAFKSIYNHFNSVQYKLFGNTQYYMADHLVFVSTQVSRLAMPFMPTGFNSSYMSIADSVSTAYETLEKRLQYIWVEIPRRTLPYDYLFDPVQLFVNLLKCAWDWLVNLLNRCLQNENKEKKKLILEGVALHI